ncbi:MAG: T9SS type A sorting domain-containing protein [Flavobacteriales bacterium]|nr:T9SS type A sorting domain-containing protein [Flavobacteriales bacterium]
MSTGQRKRSTVLRTAVLFLAFALVVVIASWNDPPPVDHARFHSLDMGSRGAGIGLVSGNNNFFMASGNCYGCHGIDTVGAVWANHDAQGRDVNMADAWRSTMMANSARDPFWKAKVDHEVLVSPGHQAAIEDKCTSCHAPLGRHDKHLSGGGPYSMDELYFDLVAQDGVSCMACHKQRPDSNGLFFSGDVRFDTALVLYGPYDEVFTGAMQSFLNITPQFGAHVAQSTLCAACHTLITETEDLSGNLTGEEFVEQATYHEWVNSAYSQQGGANAITCQGCHVPRITDGIVIAGLYDWLTPRVPFGEHQFAGGNVFMLQLLKENLTDLGLTASSTHFDTTIARTNRMLQQNTLLLDVSVAERDADTARIAVQLTNLAGHKFPSGYPSRRAFVELVVTDPSGDTLFRSGGWDADHEVIGHDAEWEPHFDVITNADQAQIYEMVMGDVNGNKTTVLGRAKEPLKDNRLPPLGFNSTHYAYDTTRIFGVPASDIDFNLDDAGQEGTGADIIKYHVPLGGYLGTLNITARVWFQAVPPRWNEEMFAHNSDDIDAFRDLFDAADGTPVLVGTRSIVDVTDAVDDLEELGLRIFPNPVRDGLLRVDGIDDRITLIEVRDIRGALVAQHRPAGLGYWSLVLPDGAGIYAIVVRTARRSFVQRVVVQ